MREPVEDDLDVWMSRLSEGDREAFDPLFRALHPRALRLARVRLSEHEAADAAQTIMMNVFARASEFESGRPALPWFYAVAANEIHATSRRRVLAAARNADERDALDVVGGDDPERAALERELRACVVAAIAALDDDGADAIRCMLRGEARPRAVGASAFRKRVSRAYARLRLLLGGLDAE